MRESDIEKHFIKKVKEAGGIQRKFVSPGHKGVPDRICGFPGGRFALIELKAPGEKPNISQIREHARWRDLGFLVFVIDDKESVDFIIKYITGE